MPAASITSLMRHLDKAEAIARGILPQFHAARITTLPENVPAELGVLIGTVGAIKEIMLKYAVSDVEIEAPATDAT